MNNGYVYILTNPSMSDLIKIGRTSRDSRERARELSNTSVPTPYKVAFEIYSNNCKDLESTMHRELSDFRVSPNREFFRYPLDKAILLLQKFAIGGSDTEEKYQAVDITEALSDKYPNHLKRDIISVRIVQPENRVWLEITIESFISDYLVDQTIRRSDLAFIRDDGPIGLFFKPEDHVQINAEKFVNEFEPFSIIMTTDLFRDSICKKIDKKYNPIYKNES